MDYYSVVHSAVAALNPNEPRTRAAVYNRARKIVSDRAVDSAAGNAKLSKELLALENAIQRIENEFLRKESSRSGGPLSARLGWMRSNLWSQRRDEINLRPRSGLIWKTAAAVSVVCALVVGGVGLSYWMQNRAKPPSAEDTLSKTKVANAIVEESGSGSDQRPYPLRRQLVYYRTTYPPGALVISKSQKFLYLVRPNVAALRYSIGIGRKCADSVGLYQVSEKEEFPGWDDPAPSGQMDLLTRTANPLGARALYLERDERRIHGISKAVGLGSALACFQLVNEDVIDLFNRVPVGTRVVAAN